MSTQGQWRGEVDGVWYGPVDAGAAGGFVNLSAVLGGSGGAAANASGLASLAAVLLGAGGTSGGAQVPGESNSLPETPRFIQAVKDHAHWKQMREEDDVILALIQHFVMET